MTLIPSRARLVGGTLALSLCLANPPARAIVPHEPDLAPGGAELLAQFPRVAVEIDEAANQDWAAHDPAWQAFLRANPGRWYPRWDRRSDRLSMAWGEGMPWLEPGLRVATTEDRDKVLDVLERRARAFMAANGGLYRIPAGVEFTRDARLSGAIDEGRIWYLRLQANVRGVPVEGGAAWFNLNSGRVVQFGLGVVTDDMAAAPTAPIVSASDAAAAGRAAIAKAIGAEGMAAKILELSDDSPFILPWSAEPRAYAGVPGRGYEFRLVRKQSFRVPDAIETWVAVHDALNGERLALYDDNKYVCPVPATPMGRVVGAVYLGPIEEVGETYRPMPFASVMNGAPINSDFNGAFPYNVGQVANTSLSGQYFNMDCQGCNTPGQAFAEVAGWGNLSLGAGGVNEVGNGFSTKAERNCYYHLNIVRQLATAHLTNAEVGGWFNASMPANVNIANTCNAFWNGNSVNFFRAGGGCNNTGEIADVMQHEWGHGLDQNTGGGNDGARGEGFADVIAFLSTHDPRLGPYFQVGAAGGIRNADEATGLYTRTNLTTHCGPPGGGGPLGYEVHCEGVLHSQTWWHLARVLRAKYGEVGGWYATERLFFNHLLVSHWSVYQGLPGGEMAQYDGVVLIDDDNGNLADGVPNGTEINDAFTHHEIAGTPLVADDNDCLPPPAPPLTLTSAQQAGTGEWQVHVSWTPVPLVTQYQVLRNDNAGVGGYVTIGTVIPPTTEYFDDDVTDGVLYTYRVQVFDTAGCLSTADNRAPITITPLLHLAMAGYTVDDSGPLANGNGIPEPGETLVVSLDVQNTGAINATTVVATLSSTDPDVTIVDGSAAIGDIPAGATRPTQAPHFTVRLERDVVCGATVPFTVELEAVEGCAVSGFGLDTGRLGPFTVVWEDQFEVDRGWTRIPPPGGRTAATIGLWVRENPNVTNGNAQLGDDHTPDPGVNCWVTGNNPDPRPGQDDIDDGCTTLRSPIIDLGGQSGLILEYWRHFNIASTEDEMLVEISNDGGANWLTLEDPTAPIMPWTLARHDLDAIIGGPANQVQLRVTACDSGNRSLVEGMLDDVRFGSQGFICDPPEAQPRLSFASVVVGDSGALGGDGNNNAVVDPGETVRLPIQLSNSGNADATRVQGTVTLVSGPAGVTVSDPSSTWPDIAPAAGQLTNGAPAHFEINVPGTVACGGQIVLHLRADYEGPGGSYSLDQDITLDVGSDVVVDIWFDDFEGGDNGFTHALMGAGCSSGCIAAGNTAGCEDWQRLPATGIGPDDPPAAHSGTTMWGNDIAFNGIYRGSTCNYLESAPIDCTGRTGVRLGFWRWLTVEGGGFDFARVLVNNATVWQVPATPTPFMDTGWTWVEYDISPYADNTASVVIRFELETDGGLELGGWNIDDMRVFTRDRVCTPYTPGGCVGPPVPGAVGPYLRATPNYGYTNAEYTWAGAPIGANESFLLERTTGFRPAPSWTRLTPGGFTSTTYDDTTASGPRFYYRVVRENCAGVRGPDNP